MPEEMEFPQAILFYGCSIYDLCDAWMRMHEGKVVWILNDSKQRVSEN